jgi:hypothetical protein
LGEVTLLHEELLFFGGFRKEAPVFSPAPKPPKGGFLLISFPEAAQQSNDRLNKIIRIVGWISRAAAQSDRPTNSGEPTQT